MIERPALGAERDADIRTYPVKAGETVQAGDVVDVVGGAVGANWRLLPNEKNADSINTPSGIAMCRPTNDTLFVHIKYGYSAIGYFSVADGTLKTLIRGMPTEAPSTDFVDCCTLSANKVVTSYVLSNILRHKVIGLSGSSFSLGAEQRISAATTTYNCIITLTETSYLAIYNRAGMKASVCSVSGTSITPGTEVSLPGSAAAIITSAARLPDLSGNKRVCVCYSDSGDSNKGKAVIATINSSNVLTWGTPTVFDANATYNISFCCDEDCVIVAYTSSSGSGYVRILSVVGSTLSSGAALAINTTGMINNTCVVSDGRTIVLSYHLSISGSGDTGGGAFSVALKKSNSQLTKGVPYRFNVMTTDQINATMVSESSMLCFFADYSNSAYLTSTFLEVRGDQIAGGFENVSSQAIALQSGAGGQNIDIIFDGAAELPGITAGTTITSPGVQGYSPQDDWLWVKPWWDGTPSVAGTYIGDGAASKTISLGFQPSAVFLLYKGCVMTDGGRVQGGLAIKNAPIYTTGAVVSVTKDGFTVLCNSTSGADTNHSGFVFHYIALRE